MSNKSNYRYARVSKGRYSARVKITIYCESESYYSDSGVYHYGTISTAITKQLFLSNDWNEIFIRDAGEYIGLEQYLIYLEEDKGLLITDKTFFDSDGYYIGGELPKNIK